MVTEVPAVATRLLELTKVKSRVAFEWQFTVYNNKQRGIFLVVVKPTSGCTYIVRFIRMRVCIESPQTKVSRGIPCTKLLTKLIKMYSILYLLIFIDVFTISVLPGRFSLTPIITSNLSFLSKLP
jgi:hypothetical protein